MRARRVIAIVGLGLALTLPMAATATAITAAAGGSFAAASVLADEHGPLDAPHPPGVTDTPYGCPATIGELPTASPGLLEGDLGEVAGPGTSGAGISPEVGYDPSMCEGAPVPH
jgi:hypothetical protein